LGFCPKPRWSPRTILPLSALNFGPSVLRTPLPPKDMGSVSNQNCCRGYRFTEKVEKHCSELKIKTAAIVW